jgi:Ca2+-binding RTX toxin-like protein
LGTDVPDELAGKDGDDEIRGLGGLDIIYGGPGSDVIYGGPGKDWIDGNKGEDVLYGGDGNDYLGGGSDGQRDKLYCGKGKDFYFADENDYVDSSCEKGKLVDTGGPPLLMLAGALLLGSGILTYAILRRG